ncbi:MAG TPA: DUF2157 domain-containing protein [Cyanobacteria bacterium UBA8803]|nr:DUF2157 domain-containing protein [Cyanobacteria bacterium UBA9273]HBL58293.1 DUF2157 domain-containing protein [Cyanobacteria bacterium UBA8803]
MSSQPNRPLRIEVTVSASQPELLEGLDAWLRLGLISNTQVKRLSHVYLSCPLPQPAVVSSVPIPQPIPPPQVEVPPPLPTPSLLSNIWQSFQDELSVRWLLFLGVFLVVVSSGVLAATQWQNFPPIGQYGVLWGYTMISWGISFWAGQQRSLQLTAQTLQLIALLLVPVNFWAMDSFGLWYDAWEWLEVGVAAFTLTAVTILNKAVRDDSSRLTSRTALILWLSYLHWGWQWSGFPMLAVYLGVMGTAILLPKRPKPTPSPRPSRPTLARGILPNAPTGSSVVIYALTVLLVRGIFIVHLPIVQLGLAIGTCGWLLARLGKPPETSRDSALSFGSQLWDAIGGGLLLIGWWVALKETFPWQATAVSGLGISFFAQRLQYSGRRRDLAAIFSIGLQVLFLLWRLLPLPLQQDAIAILTQLTGSSPQALLSLALFPYVIFWVGGTDWLYRKEQLKLARFGEGLTLVLGAILTAIATLHPTTRSLNLFLSTITLAIVTHRHRPIRVPLIYLTHITGLLTLCSTINTWFPNLSQPYWAAILLALTIAEWTLSIPHPPIFWYRGCWHIGFVLAGLSYVLLWHEIFPSTFTLTSPPQQWGLLWLLTPLTLTGVASYSSEPRRQQASWWSAIALGMAQFLTLPFPGVRLISLAVATTLMWLNTRYLKQLAAALITIGVGLSYGGVLLWEGIPGLPQLSVADWSLVGAIATLGLWLLRSWLGQRPGTLAALYAQSCDTWAIALCSVELLMLTLQSFWSYLELVSGNWEYLITSVLLGSAILYRCWQKPTDATVYGISWTVELGMAELILLAHGSTLVLAIANIILALLTLFLTDWWLARQSAISSSRLPTSDSRLPMTRLASLEILPLLYALIGIGLRVEYFTPYTGFLTLGAALTGIGVGRRRWEWKGISYLSLAAISIAWYELVIYQMFQASGGSPADAFTIFAVVATAIAIVYRSLAWFWQSRVNPILLNFSITEIETTAHIHWAIGSCLMVLGAGMALGTMPNLRPVGIAISWVLAVYALLQGRDRKARSGQPEKQNSSPPHFLTPSDSWVYAGLIEILGTGIYARLTWTQLSVLDPWRVMIACAIAFIIYQLPWRGWGWNSRPWQHYAMVSPLLTVWVNSQTISSINLLVVAGFYGWVAHRQSNLRWSYMSLLFIDWAILRFFGSQQLIDPLWYATMLGLSLLYIAQVDPGLRMSQSRKARHHLRLLGSVLICLVALLFHQETGLLPGLMGIIAIFAGLGLRVRAFLFVGTATFLLTVFYQLVVLSVRYPFSKWVIGLIVGILFIGIAANFERRREQIIAVLQNWIARFNQWA